ncbi:phage tail tape measure protein [Aureimonas mangrovi]|uniref:phage tail tape measure protein n=1 Tax=Aureimonas mangrovi TaxID=2758041 RepID=UPI00163DE0B2|nr:phage tail tape measure protein [Aureimonas mangrovi]
MADETLIVDVRADTSAFERSLDDLSGKANAFGAAMTGALKGAVGGGRSLDGVLRGLALRISSIALDAALRPLGNLAGGLISGLVGQIGGGSGGGGATPRVTPFARGGVVRAPTFFPTGRQMGLMGEAGAEAILPLRRGADGTLGVAASGGGPGGGRAGPSIVFNVTSPDAASFRRSEVQIQAMLARAASRGQRGL